MDYALVILVAALAAFVQAAVGFGYALVFAPIAAFIIVPSDAIAVSIASSAVINTLLWIEYRPRTDIRSITPLVIAAVLAAPLGLWVLLLAEENLLRLFIATGVLVSAVVNLRHPSRTGPPRPDRLPLQVGVGALGGILRGAVSMGGPPVILYTHWIGGGAAYIRSRMFAFFFWSGVPTVILAVVTGVIDADTWPLVVSASVGLIPGIAAGRNIRPKIGETLFSRISMALLAGTASVAAVGAALTLL